MDIRAWLDQTVLPQQPPSPVQVHLVRPKESKETKKRRHGSTDSSILHVASPVPAVASKKSNASEHSSPESSSSSQPYVRKPRRKTRPDRYEPKANNGTERVKHGRQHDKGEVAELKRRAKRKKVAAKQGIINQTFQAQNVSKDRLTLQPRGKPGLFNKGRASTAVKGRGQMKFLQAQSGQAQPSRLPEPVEKQRSKDRRHPDEEISVYFAAVRPALAQKDADTQAKGATLQEKRRDISQDEEQPMSAVDKAIPTVESKEPASYWGSHNREGRHESESCISWSDSIPMPSDLPARRRTACPSNVVPLDSTQDKQMRAAVRELPWASAFGVEKQCGSDVQLQASSEAPEANNRMSRSYSLPKYASSLRHVSFDDYLAKRRALSSLASPLSKQSFVPTCDGLSNQGQAAQTATVTLGGTPHPSRSDAVPFGSTLAAAEHIGSDGIHLQNSSSVERLILDRNTNFNEMQEATVLTNKVLTSLNIPVRGHARALEPLSYKRTPTVRFAGVEEIRQPRALLSAPSIYKQQEQQSYFVQQAGSRGFDGLQEPYLDQGELFDAEEMGYAGEELERQRPTPYETDFREATHTMEDGGEITKTYGTEDTGTMAMTGFWRRHKLY